MLIKSVDIFSSKVVDQKPCRNNGRDTAVINKPSIGKLDLNDKIVSNIRNIVTNVNKNPTPLAARKRAMVRIAATVKMLIVSTNAYIPTAKKIMIGTLESQLTGSKNQKRPTPKVKDTGSINESKVEFLPKPSHKDQLKRTKVMIPRIAIPINL
jgi:hypothetical protein